MKLRWEKGSRGSWDAYLGEIPIGRVGQYDPIVMQEVRFYYRVDGVHMKWIGKASGDVVSVKSGKRSVERAWRQWLKAAGLIGGDA